MSGLIRVLPFGKFEIAVYRPDRLQSAQTYCKVPPCAHHAGRFIPVGKEGAMQENQLPATARRPLIILLTLATALIHIFLAFRMPAGPDAIFMLNGIGYIVLVTLLYLPWPLLAGYRAWVRWALMGYTVLTIILWILIADKRFIWGYIDKMIEVALVVLLWMDHQAATERAAV
jgi:hypothetical protein